ncbi:hypothetical protein A6J60_005025 [Psychrobacter sp. FDAARGOS_221]|nr:hypothetical protein A6J60_005025 [Psychrobacter sp. FDAARGOS_221]
MQLGHAQSPNQTVYKSIGKFGEVKYSQFAPESNSGAVILQLRADGQQSHSGQLAAQPSYPAATNNPAANNSSHSNPNLYSSPSPNPQNLTAPSSSYAAIAPISAAKSVTAKDPAHQHQCQTLQVNLTNLNAGGRIYEIDATGLRTYFTAADVELKLKNTEQLLAQYCHTS